MAKKLEKFPDRGKARYPWSEWLDGDPWELTKGEDFQCKPSTLRANAQTQAKKRNGRVRTAQATENGRQTVVLQFQRG